ncbi:MAG: FeoB-associated Cys-rich membrane protein [Spirochaetales bacterium]|jgi:hypothetical protein|nr:FeoB-associated Cys-rich membrane protein [Spirochaetales bacterium]
MNISTIIVLVVVVAIVGGLVFHFIKAKKNSKGKCSGSCGSCPYCKH